MTSEDERVLAETATYKIVTETVKSQITITGLDEVYSVVNKETDVVEGRAATLPDALGYMHNVQSGYDTLTKQLAQAEAPTSEDSSGEPA
jgi:hypothetical protein